MAVDLVAPAAVCAGGIPCIKFMMALGLDPVSLAAGLCGVVVIQTFLPRKEGPTEADTLRAVLRIAAFGTASMIVAAWAGPVIAAGFLGAIPDNWQWIKSLPPDHVKTISAGIAGGFAQPIVLKLPEWIALFRARLAPAPKE